MCLGLVFVATKDTSAEWCVYAWSAYDDCYPDFSYDFESATYWACWSTCTYGICALDQFVWSNPCEAHCYCNPPM